MAKRAQRAGKPCIAVCGALGEGAEALGSVGISAFYAASRGIRTMEELQKTCRDDLFTATRNAMLALR